VEYRDRNLRNQMNRANKLGAKWALIIGEAEIEKGRYQLKQMETGEQIEGNQEELLQRLLSTGG
jgi:histidyl-tRNA synthetase